MDRRDDGDDDENTQGGVDIEHDGGGGRGGVYDRRDSNSSSSFCDREGGAIREPLLNLRSRINTTSQIAIVGAKVYPIESLDYEYGFLLYTLYIVCHFGVTFLWRNLCIS